MKLVYIFTVILALTLAEEYQQEAYLAPVAAGYTPPSQRERNWESNTNTRIKVPSSWAPEVESDYYWASTSAPQQSTISTTPVPVIKNEYYVGDNGDYKYEYQIADGTSVGEQGYFNNPDQKEESLVKKGWYSFRGADGITYTVTYWADHTGYHAYGSHLPGGSSGNAPQQGPNEYPSQTAAPTTHRPTSPSKPTYPTYKPPQATYNPPQQTYNPPQQTYNPPQQTYNPPQSTYNPPQQTYNPPQQTYNPPQATYKPPQQTYNPPQQTLIPPQQTYNPPQSSYNPVKPTYNSPQQATYNQPQQQTYYRNYV